MKYVTDKGILGGGGGNFLVAGHNFLFWHWNFFCNSMAHDFIFSVLQLKCVFKKEL
jgi:hypothetical protein